MARPEQPRQRLEAGRGPRRLAATGGPRILALETATRVLGVALLEGPRVVAELCVEGPQLHSERLLPVLHHVLTEAGCGLDDLDALAVSAGPGSFTGLRIGIATVQGLVLGTACPVLPVSTLGALRLAARGATGPVAVVLDARRGELYAGVWEGPEPTAVRRVGESVFTPEELASRLPAGATLVVAEDAGPGAEAVLERVAAVRRVGDPWVAARASWVGELARVLWERGGAVGAGELRPRYLRRAEAEVERTGERLEPGPTRSD